MAEGWACGCRRARVATRKGALERVAVVSEPVSEPTAVADSRCTLYVGNAGLAPGLLDPWELWETEESELATRLSTLSICVTPCLQ